MYHFFVYWVTTAMHIAWNYAEYYVQWLNDVLDYYTPGKLPVISYILMYKTIRLSTS